MIKKFLFLFLFVLLISITSAANECKVGTQNIPFVITANFDNSTQANLTQVTYPNSSFALLGEFSMTKNNSNYNYSFNSTSTIGSYYYVTCSDQDGVVTCDEEPRCFQITPSGEAPSIATAVLYIGLLVVLLVFFIIILLYGLNTENIVGKTFSIGFGYLLLIAMLFISWQMAISFIYSSPFLVDFFRIGFIVSMVGFFPLLLILFAYGVYMSLQIKEIKDMQERGISIDEINERKFGAAGRY